MFGVMGKAQASGLVKGVIAGLLVILPVMAQAAEVERVDVVDKGVYEIVTGEETKASGTPTGVVTAVQQEKLVEPTDKIAGKIGLEFGFHYVPVGTPADAEISLDIVATFPPPGIRNPNESAPLLESRYSRARKIGEPAYLGYGFEEDWEIVPGVWTFAIWHDGKKLAEESFTVTRP